MKMFSKLAAIVICFAFGFLLNSCSNPSGGEGGSQTPTETSTPATYTITFNANNGSATLAVATQTFTAGTPQALKTIAELGFSKNGFNFAGWGTASNATQSSYADGSAYTATANATLYAFWSAIPVYSVNIPANEHGTVTATPATATAGTEITLSISPYNNYKLESISVTAGTNSITVLGDGNTRTFTMPIQNVTVTATFKAIAASSAYTVLPAGTDGSAGTNWTYLNFGLWPQTIKASDVTVDESVTETHGAFTYCKGSDGEWYVKQAKNGSSDERWFKVEPIKWRMLTTNYDGKKLLLSERALIAKRYDDGSNNYKNSEIRAWLNGDFLQSAFTSRQQAVIQTVTIDNSARSTNRDANATYYNNGNNGYVCSNTNDKIFLLSEQEISKSDYGFSEDPVWTQEGDFKRRLLGTDFSLATGLSSGGPRQPHAYWYLRSPAHNYSNCVRIVDFGGTLENVMYCDWSIVGIVPALCVEN